MQLKDPVLCTKSVYTNVSLSFLVLWRH